MTDQELRLELLKLVPSDQAYCPHSHTAYANTLYNWAKGRAFVEKPQPPTTWQLIIRAITGKNNATDQSAP